MDKNNNLAKGISVIRDVACNPSWFREHPHYWALASLPFAYSMACVEVVKKYSEKAALIYNQIIEAWSKPSIRELYKELFSKIPEVEQEEIKQAFIHPERSFSPDPNKPFKDIEELFTDFEINEKFLLEENIKGLLPPEQWKNVGEVTYLALLIMKFIIYGLNREDDIEEGKIRVFPSEKHIWLILAVVMRTAFEHADITLEKVRNFYKLKKDDKGNIVDYHKILTEQPMSRTHRRMIRYGKKANLKLKNDRIFMDAARLWYQCRVVYPSINKFCEAPENYKYDPKNVYKKIHPCDEAAGYQGSRRKTE